MLGQAASIGPARASTSTSTFKSRWISPMSSMKLIQACSNRQIHHSHGWKLGVGAKIVLHINELDAHRSTVLLQRTWNLLSTTTTKKLIPFILDIIFTYCHTLRRRP